MNNTSYNNHYSGCITRIKICIFTILMMLIFDGNSQNFRRIMNEDIPLLQKNNADKIILFHNGCYPTRVNCYDFRIFYLIYRLENINYLRIYYIKKAKTGFRGKPIKIEGKKEFKGFDSALLWNFYDTCKLVRPRCDTNMLCSDCCTSGILYYVDTSMVEYYFDGDLNSNCPESPYVKFMTQVSDCIYNFVFIKNRFTIKANCRQY